MRHLAFVLTLAAAGCFNPKLGEGQVACGSAGQCPSGYDCNSVDNRCYHTLPSTDMAGGGGGGGGGGSGEDMASSDMAQTTTCGAEGSRLCRDSTHSAVCMSGTPVVDRTCPPGSTCDAGHCQPPMGAMLCMTSKDCMASGTVCDLYNVNNTLLGYCTMPVSGATGNAGSTCTTPGYDNTCKTGICARDVTNPTLHACLYQCKTGGDCGGGLVCTSVVGAPSSIEGVSVGATKFCTP